MLQLSKLNWRIGAAIAVVLVIVGVVLMIAVKNRSQKSDPLAGLKPAVYQPKNSGETLPLPSAPKH
jgi:hypothetical protein